MTKTSVSRLALSTCLSAGLLLGGLTGCTGARRSQTTGQRMDDSRTAERVREALAAAPEYKFDRVQVAAVNRVVQLSGFVNTGAQRNTAGAVASKVVGVTEVVNKIAVKE